MRKWFLAVGILLTLHQAGQAQTAGSKSAGESEKVNWLTWEEAVALSQKQKRKVLLDVYTQWCQWCERMDKATFQDPEIARYINENFYAVKFDAETKDELTYKAKVYKFVRSGKHGYNELAVVFLGERLSFPSLVFLDEDLGLIQSIPGFRNPFEFEQIASYFATDAYKKTPWSAYQKSYTNSKLKD